MNFLTLIGLIPGAAPLVARVQALIPRIEAFITKAEAIVAAGEDLVNKATGAQSGEKIDPNTGLPITAQ